MTDAEQRAELVALATAMKKQVRSSLPAGYNAVIVVTDVDGSWCGVSSTADTSYTEALLHSALHGASLKLHAEPERAKVADYDHGPVYRELWRNRHATLAELYHFRRVRNRRQYGCLSKEAKQLLQGAHEQVTGMLVGVNEYWLPDVMSEAIEAAEALGL